MQPKFARVYLLALHVVAVGGIVVSTLQMVGKAREWRWLEWTHEKWNGVPAEPGSGYERLTSPSTMMHTATAPGSDMPVIVITEDVLGIVGIVVAPPGSRTEWLFGAPATPQQIKDGIWSVTIDNYDVIDRITTYVAPFMSISDHNGDGIGERGIFRGNGRQYFNGAEIWTDLVPELDRP